MSSNKHTTTTGPTIGSGPDTLTLLIAGDQYLGDPEFIISVNGEQIGGIQSVSALQSANQDEQFTLMGNWGPSATVSITFVNYASNNLVGNGNDRELYVNGISYNGNNVIVPEENIDGNYANTSSITVKTDVTTSSTASSLTPVDPGGAGSSLNLVGYHLTYDDEFDTMPTMSPVAGMAQFTTTLSAWPGSEGMRILSNGDQQYYTDATTGNDPFSQSNGVLDIAATYVGAGNTPGGGGSSGPSYTSGQITTQGSFSQQYGYFEMRAELPRGSGMWPAFWLLNDSSYLYGGWPPELDVLEAFGAQAADGEGGATQAHWDLHSQNGSQEAGGWATLPNGGNEYTGFHTYGVLWTPQTIAYYIDGSEVAQAPTPSDYTQQMYMIVNLAVGGTWPGNATGENASMKIDYLRVYSDNAAIPAVALQQVSSPDGTTNANMYGATAPDGVACFLTGTLIATPAGERPVEQLEIGQWVTTASGEARPICWIGEGRVLATRGRRNAATPVIVRKNALASCVPHADLRVTKGHSLFIDDVLIPVEFLINHRSIQWDDRAQEVSIYHIELETHDILLANGVPTESYRDDGNRWLFQNASSGSSLPRKQPCAPIHTGGPVVDAIWRKLLDRAGPRNGFPITRLPDLHLRVDGKRIDPAMQRGKDYSFQLATPPDIVRIVSRAAVPQELGHSRDSRTLGVAVRQIAIGGGARFRVIEAHDTTLADGYHDFEPDNGFRWTNGNAAIGTNLFEEFTHPIEIVITVEATTSYLDEGIPADCGQSAA